MIQGGKNMDVAQILIVEDESIVALDIKRRLLNSGYGIVDIVNTGEKAVELAGRLTPDLILMDIHLKGRMDGIEAAKVIRAQSDLPVIFLTAFADEETLQRARDVGAFGFILKPFDDNSLAPAIEMALVKHRMEQALRESETRYRSLVDTMPDAVFVTDLELNIQFCNRQAAQMFQYESELDLLGMKALILFVPEHRAALIKDAQKLLETGRGGIVEYSMLRRNGEIFPGELKGSLLRDPAGTPKGIIAVSRDISGRKFLEKQAQDLLDQVQNLARRDSLTNLYNHRYFYEIAEVEFSRTRRFKHSLAAIMIDLDHFKLVNDTYGHLVGDQVLRTVAEHMQSSLRAVDILGRVGGEEFLAILPETSIEGGLIIAERLRLAIEQNPFSTRSGLIYVTASLGMAVITKGCLSLDVLINQADKALYVAKRNGRNRVEVWEVGIDGPSGSGI